jgi:hypothetical protein
MDPYGPTGGGFTLDDPVLSLLDSGIPLDFGTPAYPYDITPYVRSFQTERGASSELDKVEAGTATIVLDNRDGQFTPFNLSSSFYPYILPMRRMRIRAKWGTFAPEMLPGMQLRLDASAITGLSDGTAVSSWADSSGNGRNATQATGTRQPIYRTTVVNGQPIVRFDGVDDYMTVADVDALDAVQFTLFVVAKARVNLSDNSPLEKWAAGSGYPYVLRYYDDTGTKKVRLAVYDGTNNPTASGAITQTNWNVITARRSTAEDDLQIFANGSLLEKSSDSTTGAVSNADALFVGARGGSPAGNYFDGDIAEIILYDRPLTVNDRQQVEGYLKFKYGLSGTAQSRIYEVFTGFVEEWPYAFPNEADSTVTVQLVDGFDLLAEAAVSGDFPSQSSGARVSAILAAVSWPGGTSIGTGTVTVPAVTLDGAMALEHIQAVEFAEQGRFFIDHSGMATFIARDGTVTPNLADRTWADDGSGMTYTQNVAPKFGRQNIRNDIRITRPGGAEQLASDLTSRHDYGIRSFIQDAQVSTDAEALALAERLLLAYGQPTTRIESITDLAMRHDFWDRVLSRELIDVVKIIESRLGLTQASAIQRIAHESDGESWTVSLNISPITVESYARLDDAAFRLDDNFILGR